MLRCFCLPGEYANQTAGGDDGPIAIHPDIRPDVCFVFSGLRQYYCVLPREACGLSHNDTGHHSCWANWQHAQPSWRVMVGLPDTGKDLPDDTVAGVRSIFKHAASNQLRDTTSSAAGRHRCFNDAASFCTGFFYPFCADYFQSAVTSSSATCTDFQIIQLPPPQFGQHDL